MHKIGYYPEENTANNVTSFLDMHAKEYPDKIAFYWVDSGTIADWSLANNTDMQHRSITMSEFASKSACLATGLIRLGIKRGDRVIVFVPMSIQLYVVMSALQRIGAIPVFLDSWTRRISLASSINQVQPTAIVSYDKAFKLGKSIPELNNIEIKIAIDSTDVPHNASLKDLLKSNEKTSITAVSQEDTALITFTTGSSGAPKGANRTHRFLAAQHYALKRHIKYGLSDIDLPVFPVFALNNIAEGVATVIPAIDIGEPKDSDAQVLINQIVNCRITSATLSPSLFNGLAKYCNSKNIMLPNLKRVITGGAPVSMDDVHKFKSISSAKIVILYGSTEVEPMAQINDIDLDALKDFESKPGVNVGLIDNGLKYKFIKIQKEPISIKEPKDWARVECAPGVAGEFIVAGEHVCNDYYDNPDAYIKSKIIDKDGTIWHRTGDIAQLGQNNMLWILGRVHNTIIRNNEYIFPVEPEIILKKLFFVQFAAYLGLPDDILGEKAVVAVVTNDIAQINHSSYELEIKNAMEAKDFPVDMIVFCDQIPMDPRHHSKVQYDVLRMQIIESLKHE